MTTSTVSTAESTALASLPGLVGLFAGNKLAGLNSTIQSGVATADADVDAKIAAFRTALDAEETGNPLVGEAITTAEVVLAALGLQLPSEDTIFAHVKSAADDLFGAIKAS